MTIQQLKEIASGKDIIDAIQMIIDNNGDIKDKVAQIKRIVDTFEPVPDTELSKNSKGRRKRQLVDWLDSRITEPKSAKEHYVKKAAKENRLHWYTFQKKRKTLI